MVDGLAMLRWSLLLAAALPFAVLVVAIIWS